VDGENWAKQEFGGAPLGDARLKERLVDLAQAKAEKPGEAFTGATDGDKPAVKAYYRFIDYPDQEAVSMEHILEPHRQRTIHRMQGQRTVLCIQYGSDFDYTSLTECEGLGVIGTNQTGAKSRGLHLHTTFAVAPNGLPLGILWAECVAPQLKSPDDKRPSYAVPIEEKDSFSWVAGLRDTAEVAAEMPQTRLVNVCDREADFFELFEEQLRNPSVQLLVRANHNRVINENPGKHLRCRSSISLADQGTGSGSAAKRRAQAQQDKSHAETVRLSGRVRSALPAGSAASPFVFSPERTHRHLVHSCGRLGSAGRKQTG
jgi:hypothetical protein